MGSWAYCHKCDLGIGPPTMREALSRGIECGRCGEVRVLDDLDFAIAVDGVMDRLEEVEKKCASLQVLVDTLLARR